MNLGMLDWLLVLTAVGLLIAGLYFRETRLAIAILLLVGGVVFNTTAFMGFIGVPMMLAAGVLLYVEFVHRPRPAVALGPTGGGTPPAASRSEPTRRVPEDDIGPADD